MRDGRAPVVAVLLALLASMAGGKGPELPDERIAHQANRPLAHYLKVLHEASGVPIAVHPQVLHDVRAVYLCLEENLRVRSDRNANRQVLEQLAAACGYSVETIGEGMAVGPAEAVEKLKAGGPAWPEADWGAVESNALLGVWLGARIGAHKDAKLKTLGDLLALLDAAIMRGPGRPLFDVSPVDATRPLPAGFCVDKSAPGYEIVREAVEPMGLVLAARGSGLQFYPKGEGPPCLAVEPDLAKAMAKALERRTLAVVLWDKDAPAKLAAAGNLTETIFRDSREARDLMDGTGAVVTAADPNAQTRVSIEVGQSVAEGRVQTRTWTGAASALLQTGGKAVPVLVFYDPVAATPVAHVRGPGGAGEVLDAAKAAREAVRWRSEGKTEGPARSDRTRRGGRGIGVR